MKTLKRFTLGDLSFELMRGDSSSDNDARWIVIDRCGEVARATAMDVLACLLAMGIEQEMNKDE